MITVRDRVTNRVTIFVTANQSLIRFISIWTWCYEPTRKNQDDYWSMLNRSWSFLHFKGFMLAKSCRPTWHVCKSHGTYLMATGTFWADLSSTSGLSLKFWVWVSPGISSFSDSFGSRIVLSFKRVKTREIHGFPVCFGDQTKYGNHKCNSILSPQALIGDAVDVFWEFVDSAVFLLERFARILLGFAFRSTFATQPFKGHDLRVDDVLGKLAHHQVGGLGTGASLSAWGLA